MRMHSTLYLWAIFCIVITGCTSPASLTPTPDKLLCANLTIYEGELSDCLSLTDTAALLQTPLAQQVILVGNGATITLRGTLYSQHDDTRWTLIALEGTAVIGADDRTRILQAGLKIDLPLENQMVSGGPSGLESAAVAQLADLPLENLSRIIVLPETLVVEVRTTPTMMSLPTSTPEIVAQEEIRPTIIDGICLPRDDWSGRYFVKRGDNLTRIARSYGLTLTQLQDANCITNPNLVRVGEELRVPQTSEAPPLPTLADLPDDFRPTLVVFDTPTFTPSAVAFRADQPTIIAGSCTVVRWDVQNVQALFFLDESVPLSGSRQVCPDATTDYILRVLYFDGTETERRLTIIVGNDSP